MTEVNYTEIDIGGTGWESFRTFSDKSYTLTQESLAALNLGFERWRKHTSYLHHNTLVMRVCGEPTVAATLCCTIYHGQIKILSVDGRGYGIGYTARHNTVFEEALKQSLADWSSYLDMSVKLCAPALADERGLLDSVGLSTPLGEYALIARVCGTRKYQQALLERHIPALTARSLVPVTHEGHRYQIGMGIARTVRVEYLGRNEPGDIVYEDGLSIDRSKPHVFRPIDPPDGRSPRKLFYFPEGWGDEHPTGVGFDEVVSAIDRSHAGFVAQSYMPPTTDFVQGFNSVFYLHYLLKIGRGGKEHSFRPVGGSVVSSRKPNVRNREIVHAPLFVS